MVIYLYFFMDIYFLRGRLSLVRGRRSPQNDAYNYVKYLTNIVLFNSSSIFWALARILHQGKNMDRDLCPRRGWLKSLAYATLFSYGVVRIVTRKRTGLGSGTMGFGWFCSGTWVHFA